MKSEEQIKELITKKESELSALQSIQQKEATLFASHRQSFQETSEERARAGLRLEGEILALKSVSSPGEK